MDERLRRRVFWTATGLIALEGTLFTLVIPALPGFVDRYGISTSVAALIFAAFPITQLLAGLGAAGPVERFGRKPVVIAATVLLGAATAGFAIAGTVLVLALARTLQGVAAGLVWTAGVAAVTDVYPQAQLGYRIGLLQTAGGGLGLVGPVLGGALISAVGISATFGIACALPAAFMIAAVRMPETSTDRGPVPRLGPALVSLIDRPAARAGALALASAAAVLALLEPLLPLDLSARHQLGAAAVGAVFAAGLLAFFLGAPLAGRWSDRHSRRTPILIGGTVVAVTLPLTAVGPPGFVAAAFFVLGLGLATLAAPAGPLLAAAVDEAGMAGRYGLSAAILTAIFAAGYAVGPLVGAAASAVLGFGTIVGIAALAVIGVAVLAYRVLATRQLTRFS